MVNKEQRYVVETATTSSPFSFTFNEAEKRAKSLEKLTKVEHVVVPTIDEKRIKYDFEIHGNLSYETLKMLLR